MRSPAGPRQRTRRRRPALLALCLGVLAACTAGAPDETRAPDVAFLAFGDSGNHPAWAEADERHPDRAQPSGLAPVANAMHAYCLREACAFALMLGDNIYPQGATGKDDAQRFRDVLVTPFQPLGEVSDGFRIYAALGNHDWKTSRAGARAQAAFMETMPPFYMDGYFYRVLPPAAAGSIEVFVLDTQLLLGAVEIPKVSVGEHGEAVEDDDARIDTPEWARPQDAAERAMAAWLDDSLRRSHARWKLVTGHHPLWSAVGGKHAESEALRTLILPSLCRYADAYFAGHEHTLELHAFDCADDGAARPPLVEVVSGAAGKQRTINPAYRDRQLAETPGLATPYAQGSTWGFAHVSVEADTLTVRMIRVDAGGRYRVDHTGTFRHRSR